MVVVNHAQSCLGQTVDAQVQSQLQTGAGVIVFADLKQAYHEAHDMVAAAR